MSIASIWDYWSVQWTSEHWSSCTGIVKVSKEELGHHSSSILRLLLTNKRKHRRKLRKTQMFQARTKSNPSGIVTKSTNMSNWQKIENLKRRSTQKKKSIDSSFTPAMTNNAFGNEEALVWTFQHSSALISYRIFRKFNPSSRQILRFSRSSSYVSL